MYRNARIAQRTRFIFMLIVGITMIVNLLFVRNIYATPELQQVAAGDVSIAAQANNLQITQASNQAILNWNSFNVQPQQSVHFQQPLDGVCLNRINAANGMSQIDGQLSATGGIILMNPAGV